MKGKSVKRIILKRVLPAVLAASMIATAAEWRNLRLMRAKASTSLPGIENIISSLLGPSGSYNILEVAPGKGEFGYYVAGQEPVKFEDTLKETTSIDDRKKWANDYLNGLEDKGILSSTDDTPLTSSTKDSKEAYTEYYPWQDLPTDDYSTLSLGHDESMKANGTPVETEGGAFSVDSSSFQFNKSGGDYVQNISFSNPLDSLSSQFANDSDFDSRKTSYVFYKPVFDSVSKKDVNQIDSTNDSSYFHFSAEKNLPLYSLSDDGKQVFDQAASEDREFKAGNQYFAIKTITEVKTGSDMDGSLTDLEKAGWYAAQIDTVKGFTKAGSGQRGYFDLDLSSFKYVGKGNGNYDLTNASADENGKYQIIYDQIRYKGGYTNNNWFAKKILDCSETSDIDAISSRINVTVVSPSSVPADLSSYGLVVISSEGKDIGLTSDAKTTLAAYAKGKGALLIDNRAISDNNFLTSAGVSSDKISGSYPNGYVDKSIYLVKTGQNERKGLVTSDLTKKYDEGDYKNSGSAFNEVYQNIEEENFLRKQKNRNTSDLLSEDVSMASCIQYIISNNVSTVRNKKTKVRILDIEPEETSEITETDGKLKEKLRKNWFGDSFKPDAITVTTMSTRKLVGKTEDISEKYDLVYVGKGTVPYPKYSDKAMNRLYYYNIGDYSYIDQNNRLNMDGNHGDASATIGMNVTDYDNWTGSAQYRRSGNDITPRKLKELQAFVRAGHPVIISDDLMQDKSQISVGFSDISLDTSTGQALLKVTPIVKNFGKEEVKYSYQWFKGEAVYKNNKKSYGNFQLIDGAVSDSYLIPSADQNKWSYPAYYCKITGVSVAGKKVDIMGNNAPVSKIIVPSDFSATYYASDSGSGSYFVKNDGSRAYPDQKFSYDKGSHIIRPPYYVNNDLSWYGNNYDYYWQDVNDPSTVVEGATADISRWKNGSVIQAFAKDKNSGEIRFASNKWKVTSSVTASTTISDNYRSNGSTGAYNLDLGQTKAASISTIHVDYFSKLYSFLTEAIGYDNVWQSKKVTPVTVSRYVNISSPEIEIVKAPESYDGNGNGILTDDTLTVSFKIVNATDPSPSTTTYTGSFYFDSDGNGLYTDEEKVADLAVAGDDGSSDENYGDSMKGGLTKDDAPTYTAAVILPEQMVGSVNWKLVVTQNPDVSGGSEYLPHASVSRICYKPATNGKKPVIDVLQVNSDTRLNNRNVYNLEEANKSENIADTYIDQYHKWLRNETVTDKYRINIVTVCAKDFNIMKYPNGREKRTIERDGDEYTIESGGDINLDAYDMIILGFSDMYQSLDRKSCYRIQDFADSGKSVLFTHDNSSHAYLTKSNTNVFGWYIKDSPDPNDHAHPENKNAYAWAAFDFNTTLRSLDKMDVYGITDTKLGSGGVSEWNVKDKDGNYVQNGFLAKLNPQAGMTEREAYGYNSSKVIQTEQLTAEQISMLKNAGYSIAYKPEAVENPTGEVKTVPQTQAYTDGLLDRWKFDKGDIYYHTKDDFSKLQTNNVKQVNKGTITTYPYYLNNADLLRVSTTHCQYSQLNLNSDNIVVWYTLDNSYYRDQDVANDYYLFSCDNIFYTGAGHRDNPTEAEAKLFINTMIAAYRQQASKPKAYFTGSATSRKQVSSYLVQTGGKTMSAIDVLRNYIEDFTGNDTSQYTDQDFKDRSPVKDLDMTVYDLNIAAKAATIRLAYSMTNDDKNRGTEAINRIQNLKLGPWLGSDSKVIDGVTSDTTVSQICAGINTLLLGKTATYNEAVPGLTPDKNSVKDQKYYFTIKDDNTGTKTITPKFYLYSTKQIDNIDTNRFKETKEENDGRTTGYYYDITDYVTEYEPKSDNAATNFGSNKIYGLKLDENNPALDILLEKGTVTIAIEPSVEVKSKKKTMTGQKTKVTINTAGLLQLG